MSSRSSEEPIYGNQVNTLVMAFSMLTPGERQLLTCALAGNHPPQFAKLRMPVLRALAKAQRQAREKAHR